MVRDDADGHFLEVSSNLSQGTPDGDWLPAVRQRQRLSEAIPANRQCSDLIIKWGDALCVGSIDQMQLASMTSTPGLDSKKIETVLQSHLECSH